MNKLEYKEGIPEDKGRLCVFYDGDYYIDTFNNLSSSEQKQLLKWAYLPLIDNSQTEKVNNESDKEITVWPESFSNSPSGCYITCKAGNGTHEKVYVLRNSQAHEFFLRMTRMAPVIVTMTVDPNSFNMVINHARWDNKEYVPQHQRYL